MTDLAHSSHTVSGNVGRELWAHVPFTMAGTLTGILLMVGMNFVDVPHGLSENLFCWGLHPLHVFLSAAATTAMYRRYSGGNLWATIAVGYVGAVGVATLSDCLIPFVAENALGLRAHVHPGFIEMWWLVNPLAAAGIALAYCWPKTRYPHAGHVLLSTWASLFHMMMALHGELTAVTLAVVAVFLFLAVWVPCCTSDIVFPLLFARKRVSAETGAG